MQLLEIGGRGYVIVPSDEIAEFTPLFDRAARVTNIAIACSDDSEDWMVSVAGKELMRTRVPDRGNNSPFGQCFPTQIAAPLVNSIPQNLFTLVRKRMGRDMSIPVPNGQTLTVQSVNGGEASIVIEFEECSPGDLNPSQINHPQSNQFLMVVTARHTGAVTSTGLKPYNTQTSPLWVPNLFNGAEFPSGYSATMLGLFIDGLGDNAFAAATDHVSASAFVKVTKNGQQMFTRSAKGLPLKGRVVADGAAAQIFGACIDVFPPVQSSGNDEGGALDPPLVYKPGDTVLWELDIAGDVGAGADYSEALIQAVVLVTRP